MTVDVSQFADGVALAEDGIWYADATDAISYPAHGNELCAAIEDRSFWFTHRNACILAAMRQFPPGGTVFDIGGGNGFVAAGMRGAGFEAAVVEPGRTGAHYAKSRGIDPVICASTETAAFRDGSLPAVGLFDVLEHVEDDRAFARVLRAALQSGGRVYLTVPAHVALWSHEDKLAGHFRRYSIPSVTSLLHRADFEIEFASYFFRALPLPIALLRSAPYRFGFGRRTTNASRVGRDHVQKGRSARLLARLLRDEPERIARRESIGFGASCLVVARTP